MTEGPKSGWQHLCTSEKAQRRQRMGHAKREMSSGWTLRKGLILDMRVRRQTPDTTFNVTQVLALHEILWNIPRSGL